MEKCRHTVCWVLLGGYFHKPRCHTSITMQLHLLHVWRVMVGREALGFHGEGAESGLWQAGGTTKKMPPRFLYFFPSG